MIKFIKSPIYYNWLSENLPNKSLHICSPFIKQSTLKQLLQKYNFERCNIDLKIIIRADETVFKQGSTDIASIEYLSELIQQFPNRVNVSIVDNLHMKAFLIDKDNLLITSGNLTERGIMLHGTRGNAEGGIACDDAEIIKEFLEYFDDIFNSGNLLTNYLTTHTLDDLKAKYISTTSTKPKNHSSESKNLFSIKAPTNKTTPIVYSRTSKQIEYIPQSGSKKICDRAIEYMYNTGAVTINELSIYLGSTAENEDSQNRLGSSVIHNTKMLGLSHSIKTDKGMKHNLTDIGIKYFLSSEDERIKILKEQSKDFLWIKDLKLLQEFHPDETIDNLIMDYLCNEPNPYKKSTAQRYKPAMKELFSYHNK